MGNLARFTIFFLGCILLAALLTPWLYLGVQSWALVFDWSWLKELAKHPFHRYFNRVLQASIIVGIWGLLRRSGFLSLKAIGLRAERPGYLILTGFGMSIVLLGGYGLVVLSFGWYRMKGGISGDLCMTLAGKIFLTAFVVGLMEELFFRGYFYQMCKQELNRRWALTIQVIFFSSLHYIKPPRAEDLGGIDWSAGFRMLGLAFQRFDQPLEVFGGILVLIWVAWMLCWTLERTGNIYLAIGLHAGWVFALQFISALTRYSAGWPTWILGGGDLSQGIVTLIPLIFQFLILNRWFGQRRNLKQK